MADRSWPKLQVLHPWQGAPEAPIYVPFSTKICGWAIDPNGPCRVELRLGETLIATATADVEETHASAITMGGCYYRKSCGFSFSLGAYVNTDPFVPLDFTVRAFAENGDWSECIVTYRGHEQQAHLRSTDESLEWEQASLQKLLVYSFTQKAPTYFCIFVPCGTGTKDSTYIAQCAARAQDISLFFPLSDRLFYTLDGEQSHGTDKVQRLRSLADLTVNPQDFIFMIDPSERWSYADEIGCVVEAIVAGYGSPAADKEVADRASIPNHRRCLCGNEFKAMIARDDLSAPAVQRRARSDKRMLGGGHTFINVNGPVFDPRRIGSILVIKLDRIGDVISMIPALRQLRQLFPNARISAFVTNYTAPIIRTLGVVDDVLVRNDDRLLPDGIWDLAVDMRLDADSRSVLKEVKAHIKLSASLPTEPQIGRPMHITIPSLLPTSGTVGRSQTQHVVERLNAIVGGLSVHLNSFFPEERILNETANPLPATASDKGEAPEAYCVVAPGPPQDVRSWSTNRLAQLVARFAQTFGLVVKLVGAEREAGDCDLIERHLSAAGVRCVNLSEKLSSDELLSLIRWSRFFVGADSGPKHIAGLFGIAGISLHGGRHSPRVWGATAPTLIDIYSPVSCSPCLVNKTDECWNGLLCMENISVDHAWNAAVVAWALDAWRAEHQCRAKSTRRSLGMVSTRKHCSMSKDAVGSSADQDFRLQERERNTVVDALGIEESGIVTQRSAENPEPQAPSKAFPSPTDFVTDGGFYSDDVATSSVALRTLRMLRPHKATGFSKIRVGKENDGGYIMLDDFDGIAAAYSFGISNDVSWDLQIADRGLPIYQYDHTIDALPKSHIMFHWSKIGIGDAHSGGSLKPISLLMEENGHALGDDLILKCDIEGNEWQMLSTIPDKFLNCFRQIVIEVHGFDCLADPNLASFVEDGVRVLTRYHRVIHVHGNNNSRYCIIGGVPLPKTLELTLVRADSYELSISGEIFPTPLDQPCWPDRADFSLGAFTF